MKHPYPSQETQITFVTGDERSRGRQHAEQLKAVLEKGMAPFYYRFFKRLLNPEGSKGLSELGYRILAQFIDKTLTKQLDDQIPSELKERIKGVSEVSGIPEDVFRTSLVLPDLLPMLQAYWLKLNPKLAIDVAPPPKFGCSSFIAKGNRFLVGRNLDFPGVGYWDRFPVIEVVTPQTGFKYIGFTSAGVPIAGISGINENGLMISLHQHYSFETHLRGKLPFIVSEKILRQARNLDEALEMLKRADLASSWAFIVADRKSQNGFIFEATPKRYAVRWLKDENQVLTHSNYFISAELKGTDYATTERMNWDNFWRREYLEKNIRKEIDNLSLEKAVQWLSGHEDSFWGEEKIVNRTVSQVYNIQSYVLDLNQMKVYFAEGNCPIHLGAFKEYDLQKLFEGKVDLDGSKLPAYQFKNLSIRKAKQDYILSFVSAFDNRFSDALRELKSSLSHTETPEAYLVAALVSLKLGQSKQTALDYLQSGRSLIENKIKEKSFSLFPPEYFEICLYEARVLELLQRKTESQSLYQHLALHPSLRDQNIKKIVSKPKAYSEKKLRRLVMPYSTYIPFE